MKDIARKLNRRKLLVAGGFGAMALAAAPGSAVAAPAVSAKTEKEKANAKVVMDFCNSFNEIDKAVALLSPDAYVRMVEDAPGVYGPAATAAGLKGFMANGEKISVKFNNVAASGPVVVTNRIDTMATPGKPDQVYNVVGVFVVKGGKIKEWSDFLRE